MKTNINDLAEEAVQLLPQIFKVISREYQFYPKGIELSVPQMRFLRALYERKEANMKELSEALEVAPPSATITADQLVSHRLILRKEDKEDRRVVRIALTSKGKTIVHQMLEARKKRWLEIMDSLNENEQETLIATLQKLLVLLNKTEKTSEA